MTTTPEPPSLLTAKEIAVLRAARAWAAATDREAENRARDVLISACSALSYEHPLEGLLYPPKDPTQAKTQTLYQLAAQMEAGHVRALVITVVEDTGVITSSTWPGKPDTDPDTRTALRAARSFAHETLDDAAFLDEPYDTEDDPRS